MRIAIITCKEVPRLIESERPLLDLFKSKGITAHIAIWDDPTIDWRIYDYLVIRSIWDYHLRPDKFIAWLDLLESNNVPTLNSIDLLRANYHKFYLEKLSKEGVPIVPTYFIDKKSKLDLSFLKSQGCSRAVIKPAVSASSFYTKAFDISDIKLVEEEYKDISTVRDLLVQEFMPEVINEGELSIIFLGGEYAYTVLKTAKKGEFRVQSEYGGSARLIEPDAYIIAEAAKVLSKCIDNVLYARVDGVIRKGQFMLMEIELIEPDLFFNLVPDARSRFVLCCMNLMGV